MICLWTALFAVPIPGTVFVFVPFALVANGIRARLDLGLAVIFWRFADVVRCGRGALVPHDLPRELVVASCTALSITRSDGYGAGRVAADPDGESDYGAGTGLEPTASGL